MFPYEEHKNTELWQRIDKIVADLEKNGDVKLTTAREYVVGYFCKKLSEGEAK